MSNYRYRVSGINQQGEWEVVRPDGYMCNGTWKTKEDAEQDCKFWNGSLKKWEDKNDSKRTSKGGRAEKPC